MAVWSIVQSHIIQSRARLDAEFYQPMYLSMEAEVCEGDLLDDIADVFHPTEIKREYQEGNHGIQMLLAQNVRQGHLNFSIPFFMSYDVEPKLTRNILQYDDVVITRSGANFGDAAVYKNTPQKIYACADVLVVRAHKVPGGYLATYFNTRHGRGLIKRGSYGMSQPHIAPGYLLTLHIPRLGSDIEEEIDNTVIEAYNKRGESQSLYAQAEALLLHELGLDTLDLSHQTTFTATFAEVMEARRLDAEYFQPKYQRAMQLMSKSGQHIGDIASLSKQRFKPDKNKDFQYIEIGDITSDGLAMNDTIEGADAPSRAQWVVSPGDVITSTVRPIRRLTALIEDHQKGYVCSSGFAVLEPQQIPGELLMTYLRLPIVCEILDLHTTASMYPAISTQDLMKIPITMPSKEAQQKVVEQVRAARTARKKASQLLEQAKQRVEELILGEEM